MADLDLSSTIARTSRSYDALPYTSDSFPNTHPALLAAVARLFALDAAAIGEARILELGCALGGNIIPLAARHPGAAVVGIDISSTQVAAAHARVADLNLTNIEVRCQNIDDLLGTADAPFDYIICHGVYSWVPAPLREAILRICRQRLSPRGIAVISYNVLPGWRMLQVLRDCFLLHTSADDDPHRRVAAARTLTSFLPQACPQPGPYRDFLAAQAERLPKFPDAYIAHDLLEEVNEPCTVRDFVEAADRHGLAFLGDSEISMMIPSSFPPDMAEVVQKFAGGKLLATEQYIDIVSGRTFRYTLLVGTERAASIDRTLSNGRLEGLHFLGRADLVLRREADGATLEAPNGRKLRIASASLADALAGFIARFPSSSSVDDLVEALPAAQRDAGGRAQVRGALLQLVMHGLATPRTEPVRTAARAGRRPIACPVARVDGARGAPSTVNLRHERVEQGKLANIVLPLLDGTRDLGALSAAVAEAARDGRITFARNGLPVADPGERKRIASENVAALLPMLARAALLRE